MSNLGIFTMPTSQRWPFQLTQEANFQKILFFPISAFNIREKTKFLVEKLSTSEVTIQKPDGDRKYSPSAFRVKIKKIVRNSGARFILNVSPNQRSSIREKLKTGKLFLHRLWPIG